MFNSGPFDPELTVKIIVGISTTSDNTANVRTLETNHTDGIDREMGNNVDTVRW